VRKRRECAEEGLSKGKGMNAEERTSGWERQGFYLIPLSCKREPGNPGGEKIVYQEGVPLLASTSS